MIEPQADCAVRSIELTKRYGGLTAVDEVTVSIAAGEVFGLIGPNGAGKSSLTKMLATLLPPTSGTATVAGFDVVRQARDVRRHIGYVPQTLSADATLTGRENLLLSAGLYAIPRARQAARTARALARMGLEEVADRLVGQYSGGMIRRLEIAQSVLHHPAVLFMDEPTVGLDPAARKTVWRHLLELKAESGATILLTTHYMEEAEEYCTRIAILAAGRIAAIGTPAELKARSGKATLEEAFGDLTRGKAERDGDYDRIGEDRRAAQEYG